MTHCPFRLPDELIQRLPSPAADGCHYVDVRVARTWDGVLVINKAGFCIGVYLGRCLQECCLPFEASEIEDVRAASLHNRVLAALPFDLWGAALLTIGVFSPTALLLGHFVAPPLALFAVVGCAAAIHVMYLSWEGWPLIRLPMAVLGVNQIVWGLVILLRWLRELLTAGIA
jgi:hypothetical protein